MMTVTGAVMVFSTFPGDSAGRSLSFAFVDRRKMKRVGEVFALVGPHFSTAGSHTLPSKSFVPRIIATITSAGGSRAGRIANGAASQVKPCGQEVYALVLFAEKRAIISRLKTGRSEGCRLLIQFRSRTTSRSSHWPPELRMSSWIV